MQKIPTDIPQAYLAGGEAIFYAFECVLLQTETYNGFIFTAVNINNGKKKIISRRKNPLYLGDEIKMAEKIWQSGIAGTKRLEIDRPFGSHINFKKCEETLEIIFREILINHDFVVRPEQIEMAKHILLAIYKHNSALIESGTGTGKTLAYLVAAIIVSRGRINDFWNMGLYSGLQYTDYENLPVVIATSSIALQKALTEYIPQISDLLLKYGVIRTPIKSVLRKGKNHYICDKRLDAQLLFENDSSIKNQLEQLRFTPEIDLAEIPSLPPRIKNKICVSERCDAKNCSRYKHCRYINHLEQANSAKFDIHICNHNYLLADTLRRSEGKKPLIKNYQLLILDEAHKYLSVSQNMYSKNISENELPSLINSIKRLVFINSETEEKVKVVLDLLADKNIRLFKHLNKSIIPPDDDDDDTERLVVNIDSDVTRHIRKIREFIAILSEILELNQIKSESLLYLRQISGDLNSLLIKITEIAAISKNIYWYEQIENENTLYAMPKDLNLRLFNNQWNKVPTIFISGTLSAGGDFSHIKRTLGLDRLGNRLTETSRPSSFNYRENALIYIPENIPFPDNKDKDYISAITDEVERLIYAAHGHTAVLFTSYNVMGRVYTTLKQRGIPFPLMQLDKGGVHEIERFKQSKNGVLFASGALWEGIDIPGDALSMLIIVKLPFAVPDPIGEYEQTLYRDINEYKHLVIVPEMLIKLKQGFGRLIRTEKDTGCIAILDSRVNIYGSYRRRVLTALPGCRVTADINDIKIFLRAKKPSDYFEYNFLSINLIPTWDKVYRKK